MVKSGPGYARSCTTLEAAAFSEGIQRRSVTGTARKPFANGKPEQARRVLNLVDDDRSWVPVEKRSRIFFRLFGFRGQVERDEGVGWEQTQKRGGLPRLASSSQNDHGARGG